MTKLEQAARQALEALEEMFHSNSTKFAVEKYNTAHNALREALAEQAEQEPVGEMIDKSGYKGAAWYLEPPATGTKLYAAPVSVESELIETNKALAKEIIELKKQAEQEPVAWFVQFKNRHEFVFGSKPEFIVDGVVEPLYAAPVRTKDLTDDEVENAMEVSGIPYYDITNSDLIGFARAVIAADREKNNV